MIRRLMLTTVIAILPLAVTAALPRTAIAGDARRDAILADYAAKAGTASFSAQRGETLFRTKSTGGDPRTRRLPWSGWRKADLLLHCPQFSLLHRNGVPERLKERTGWRRWNLPARTAGSARSHLCAFAQA